MPIISALLLLRVNKSLKCEQLPRVDTVLAKWLLFNCKCNLAREAELECGLS